MSREAREEFEEAQQNQQIQNQARKIRTEVDRAQDNLTYAAKRWPFELLQNAHDTGPRRGRGQIRFSLRLDQETLIVEHNGDFFTNQDLAALLSGGSNKEYDGEETTGRFGTGFLMTHAISAAPTVKGVLEREKGNYERFEIQLERSGDEEGIRKSIRRSREAIEDAEPIGWHDVDDMETAEFVYPLEGQSHEVARQGIKRFKDALPYLFATCEDLGSVHLEIQGEKEVWVADQFESYESAPETDACYREIEVRDKENDRRLIRAVSISNERNSNVSAVTVLKQTDEASWAVQELGPDLPRVFVQFPIADTETVSLGCVLNGGFDPAKERDALRFESSKENLETALTVIHSLLKLGASREWRGLHRLAHLDEPEAGIGKGDKEEEIGWWSEKLRRVAEQLSGLKIVQADGWVTPKEVAFLYPGYNKDSDGAFQFDAMYRLAKRVRSLRMIQPNTARDWAAVASGWENLGVSLQRFGLRELADHIQREADHIEKLPVDGKPRRWLADFLLLLFEVGEQKNYSVVLDGIIPNQTGNLGSLSSLSIDGGIGSSLKDVAESLGNSVRSRLLDLRLQQTIRDASEEAFRTVQNEAGKTIATSQVINECLNKLDSWLEDDTRVVSLSGDTETAVEASARLIRILDSEDDKRQRIQRCPLLKKDSKIGRVSPEHRLMAPEGAWPESAGRFSEIYPESLVLHTWYDDSDIGREAVNVLSERGLLHKTPIIHESRSEIKDDLLRQISDAEIDSKDRLRDEEFTQIAKLYQVLSRCKRDRDLSQAVMGFVLNHAVVEDSSWRETKTVEVYRDKEPREVEVQKALWPAELLDQAWIPMHQDGEEMTTVSARDAPIMDFVQPEWLRGNPDAHKFLNQVFGIGKLDVVLHSHDDENEREQLEDTLAEITLKGPDTLKALAEQDPSLLADVAEEIRAKEEREQKKEENRRFGLAVQEAVQVYLEDRGIEVTVVDRGYDFDLQLPGDPELEDGTHHLECGGRIKLEVKATRQSSVKLTPKQVRTARQEGKCFALCVVDLRDVGEQRIWDEWTSQEIEPHTRIIRSVGSELEEPSRTIEDLAQSSNTVSIGRSNELRYRVHAPFWEKGQKIKGWVSNVLEGMII